MIKTKLFIATPAFDGKVNIQYAICLARTLSLLNSKGIDVHFQIVASGSLLVAERNRLNKAFLLSDCTHMLCIDSDLGWPAECVLGMLGHDLEFVVGLYPARGKERHFLFRPSLKKDNSLVVNEKGLVQMQYVPAGFMLIKRNVIEKMNNHFSNLYFQPIDENLKNENGFCLFNTEVRDGEFWGEDYVFCGRAREAGFEIWVDPMIQFDHAGVIGMFHEFLIQKNPV